MVVETSRNIDSNMIRLGNVIDREDQFLDKLCETASLRRNMSQRLGVVKNNKAAKRRWTESRARLNLTGE